MNIALENERSGIAAAELLGSVCLLDAVVNFLSGEVRKEIGEHLLSDSLVVELEQGL